VSLPDLKGKSLNDAIKTIQDLGLKVGTQSSKDDKDATANQVISTDPGPGALDKGSTVNLVVATGTVKLPNLVGQPYTQAVSRLADLGLKVADNAARQTDPQNRPADTVISQNPGPGSVPVHSTVTLVLSSGPAPTTPTSSPPASPSAGPSAGASPTGPTAPGTT